MWPNPQETADLVTYTEEILNGKFHFLCGDILWLCFKGLRNKTGRRLLAYIYIFGFYNVVKLNLSSLRKKSILFGIN